MKVGAVECSGCKFESSAPLFIRGKGGRRRKSSRNQELEEGEEQEVQRAQRGRSNHLVQGHRAVR